MSENLLLNFLSQGAAQLLKTTTGGTLQVLPPNKVWRLGSKLSHLPVYEDELGQINNRLVSPYLENGAKANSLRYISV